MCISPKFAHRLTLILPLICKKNSLKLIYEVKIAFVDIDNFKVNAFLNMEIPA